MEIINAVELFVISRQADGRSPATIRDYRRVLDRFASAYGSLGDLDRDSIRAYVASLANNGWSPGHVAIHIRNIRAFLSWCYSEGYMASNAANAIKAPKKVNRIEAPLSPDEIRRLLATCGATPLELRDRAIILILLDTGLRADELLRVQTSAWQRYDDGRSIIHVYAPKTDKARIVCLGQISTAALVAYTEAMNGQLDGRLWGGRHGKIGYNGLYKMLRRRAERAGLDPVRAHPHIFRKTFATTFLDAGGDIERLRVLGGWAGYEMLKIYVESSSAHLREAHKRAGPVDALGL